MRRKHLPWILLGAVVVALVALNVAMQEDPELPTPSAGDEVRLAPREEPRSAAETQADGEGEAPPEGAAADGEPEVEEAEPDPSLSCEHPLIVTERGQWRLYRWTMTGMDEVVALRIDPRRTRELTSGERVTSWVIRARNEADDEELSEHVATTRCVPGQDAEEPWFGILERHIGNVLTDEPGRWRWPAELTAGARFEGTAVFDPSEADARRPDGVLGPQMLRITRRHHVERREEIEVPAGTFQAWRVAYEEQHTFGEPRETATGTLWVAPDVGLVKSVVENSEGQRMTIELTRMAR